MSRFRNLVRFPVAFFTILAAIPVLAGGPPVGRVPTDSEIAAWNTDVRFDGQGLPLGQGSVSAGEALYSTQCASCHGDFGEGVGRWPALAGGQGTLADDRPQRTIGSYWPYAATIWDYVNRAMPYGNARSLSANEVYSLTAYLLYLNDFVGEDFTLTRKNLVSIHLPNAENFRFDDRKGAELLQFSLPVCMTTCKTDVRITKRAATLNVTPD